MTTPALQQAWHHLTQAQVAIIKADDHPHTPDDRRTLIASAQNHAKKADVILKQYLAQRHHEPPRSP
jgi:hypothetical protein